LSGAVSVGGLAHLVERLLCKQEVIGSSPIVSTKVAWQDVFTGLAWRRWLGLSLYAERSLHQRCRGVPESVGWHGAAVAAFEERSLGDAVFFGGVNQVLVRLWARWGISGVFWPGM
jgi:hypothetical protein